MKRHGTICLMFLLFGSAAVKAGIPQLPVEILSAMSDIIVEVETTTEGVIQVGQVLKDSDPPCSRDDVQKFLSARKYNDPHDTNTLYVYFLNVRNEQSIVEEVSRLPNMSEKRLHEYVVHPAYKYNVSKRVPIIAGMAHYRGPTLATQISTGHDDVLEFSIDDFRSIIHVNAYKSLDSFRVDEPHK